MEFQLKKLSPPTKLLLQFFVLSLFIGYVVALMQVYEHTHFSLKDSIVDYRGSDNPELMAEPMPYRELLQITHAHALSVPIVYFLLSAIFLGTSLNPRSKKIMIALLFSGFILEYAGLWLLRFAHSYFVYLAFVASGLSSLSYLYMCCKIEQELIAVKS